MIAFAYLHLESLWLWLGLQLAHLWSPFRWEFLCNPHGEGLPVRWSYMFKPYHPRTWWLVARVCWACRHAYRGRWLVWFAFSLGACFEVLVRGRVPS